MDHHEVCEPPEDHGNHNHESRNKKRRDRDSCHPYTVNNVLPNFLPSKFMASRCLRSVPARIRPGFETRIMRRI